MGLFSWGSASKGSHPCATCGAKVKGRFCASCGAARAEGNESGPSVPSAPPWTRGDVGALRSAPTSPRVQGGADGTDGPDSFPSARAAPQEAQKRPFTLAPQVAHGWLPFEALPHEKSPIAVPAALCCADKTLGEAREPCKALHRALHSNHSLAEWGTKMGARDAAPAD